MATLAAGDASERTVFVRKATGLVRGWSTRDAFIYAAFSINLVTLGLFIFGYAPFVPEGSLFWAVLLAGGYLVVQGITYASLIAAMPRAGGDYVYLTRAFGRIFGFLFGWAQLAVILTGSIGMMAFVFADYAAALWSRAGDAGALIACVAVAVLTLLNVLGLVFGKATQNVLSWLKLLGLALERSGFDPDGSDTEFLRFRTINLELDAENKQRTTAKVVPYERWKPSISRGDDCELCFDLVPDETKVEG